MTPTKRPARGDSLWDIGTTKKSRWSLQEIGLYTVGEILDATDAQICKARGIGPVRAAALRRLAEGYLSRPAEVETVPPPVLPADPRLLSRPVHRDLIEFAGRQDERVRMVFMRGLGDGPGDCMSWSAMARRLGVSLPTLGRARIRARDCLREDPLGMLLRRRIDALRRSEGPRLGEALRAEPWAEGMPDRAVSMLARMLVGVDIEHGLVAVHS